MKIHFRLGWQICSFESVDGVVWRYRWGWGWGLWNGWKKKKKTWIWKGRSVTALHFVSVAAKQFRYVTTTKEEEMWRRDELWTKKNKKHFADTANRIHSEDEKKKEKTEIQSTVESAARAAVVRKEVIVCIQANLFIFDQLFPFGEAAGIWHHAVHSQVWLRFDDRQRKKKLLQTKLGGEGAKKIIKRTKQRNIWIILRSPFRVLPCVAFRWSNLMSLLSLRHTGSYTSL